MTARKAVGLGLVIGAVGWVLLWMGTTPRAGWDSLVYHKLAFESAGLAPDEQDAMSWDVFARYGSLALVGYVRESLDGQAWHFDVAPGQERWEAQYRMRPAYPALVGAAFPILGERSPLAASAAAVVLFFVTTFAGLFLLAGQRVAAIATVLGLANVLLTPWLVILTPDGLGVSLWAVILTTGALWISQGRPIWLLALVLGVMAAALTRPLGLLAPLVFGICAIAALAVRATQWRRFAAATLAAAIPAALVLWLFSAAGFPGFLDLLQDLPTEHFTRPDVADPVGWIVSRDVALLTQMMPLGLLGRPLVLALLIGGAVGLVTPRAWWTAPFLAALPVVLVSFLLHPEATQLDRTLAPAWISIHTGLALLVVVGAVRWRSRVMAAADRFTQPPVQGAGT